MNLQTVDLNLLVVFEALMEERGVTRAANRVGLSQPAMSNALARLRRTFDDPLFVRTPEGMSPTPAAQSLIGPVRSALAQLRDIFEEKPAFAPSASERLFHLLTNDYVELTLLPLLVEAIREQAGRRLPSRSAFAERLRAAVRQLAGRIVRSRHRLLPRRVDARRQSDVRAALGRQERLHRPRQTPENSRKNLTAPVRRSGTRRGLLQKTGIGSD
jgi:Transcriptional regulator